MQFNKEAVFLGVKDMKMRDGAVLKNITFFVDGAAVEVSVLATNTAVVSALEGLSFGASCTATFMLRKSDKLYRLSLVDLA